jgi:prephenate dehydratase
MKSLLFSKQKKEFDVIRLVTLGPKGTSSEKSACHFGKQLMELGVVNNFRIHLSDTYENAQLNLIDNSCDALVVANAYHGVNEFYMDTRLNLYSAYMNETPNYGIAIKRDSVKKNLRIATHPAPVSLIKELLPPDFSIDDIEFRNSTSSAAISVSNEEVDAALTTQVAADINDLVFISEIRPIKMLWSVFTAQPN